MNLEPLILQRLIEDLESTLARGAPGYCIRIDHLDGTSAEIACQALRGKLKEGQQTFVLSRETGSSGLQISPATAIEIRNRKSSRLCLFVPSGMDDAAASSLANSFAVFDYGSFSERLAQELLGSRPQTLRRITTVRHSITRYQIRLEAYSCHFSAGARKGLVVPGAEWFTAKELRSVAMSSAHRKIEDYFLTTKKRQAPYLPGDPPRPRTISGGIRRKGALA